MTRDSWQKSEVVKSGTYVIENRFTGQKYVGRSNNIQQRVEQHNSGRGAIWTSEAGPGWKLVKVYKGNDNATENAIARGVMRNEGIENVRGGSYCKSYFPRDEFQAIKAANGFTNFGRDSYHVGPAGPRSAYSGGYERHVAHTKPSPYVGSSSYRGDTARIYSNSYRRGYY
jgi:predicted GIY-YIG superfamily endonuclease